MPYICDVKQKQKSIMKNLSQMEEITEGYNASGSKNSSESFDYYEFLQSMGAMALTYNWNK